MKLAYPAIFISDEEGGYTVEFPDLPGCVTEGNSMAEALFMAEDAASGWILTMLEEGEELPEATDLRAHKAPDGGFVSMVPLDMDTYTEKYGSKAVKKTLTIPAWMNTYVEAHGISCSKMLQDAINASLRSQKTALS